MWNDPELDLPSGEAANFVSVQPQILVPGTKIYRVTGGNKAGGYWTIQKPNNLSQVIGGTAVRPEWNDFSKIYVYEVPQGPGLKVWQGPAARQRLADGIDNPHLPGGEVQIFIPQKLRDSQFISAVNQIEMPW
jgi:hypothetical protein